MDWLTSMFNMSSECEFEGKNYVILFEVQRDEKHKFLLVVEKGEHMPCVVKLIAIPLEKKMTAMIERVARAIAPNFGPPFDEWQTERDVKRCWGIFGYETQEQLLLAARDAIEAMREPTEAMGYPDWGVE